MTRQTVPTSAEIRRGLRRIVATLSASAACVLGVGCFTSSPAPNAVVAQPGAPVSKGEGESNGADGVRAKPIEPSAGQPAQDLVNSTGDAAQVRAGAEPSQTGEPKSDDAPPSAAESPEKSNPAASAKTEEVKANGAAPTTSPPAATDELGRDRFVLLLPGGPLVVELVTTLDGRRLGESLDETLARLLKEGDADHDGRTTWDELTRQPAFQRGVYGNLPIGADNDRRQVIQRYDWNRDKLVSRDELLRWLVRETHRAKALIVDSLAGGRDATLADSLLLKMLDIDRDGGLTDDELRAAAARLTARDTDEDEVIVEADLRPTNEMTGAAAPAMTRNEGGAPAVLSLSAKTDWATFQRQIQDAYSLGGPLGPEAWPAGAQLFDELDVNHDGLVGRSEWSLLRVIEPHLKLQATFGAPSDALTLERVAPELAEVQALRTPKNAWQFDRPTGRLELILTPLPLPDFAAQAQAGIAQFDANKNGYLEEDEAAQVLAQTGGQFGDVDADGNGQLVADEIVAALKKRQSVSLDQVRVQAGFRPDAWWQFADANGDGRLDVREIESLAARFRTLDRDANGAVERDELPTAFVLSVTRGGGEGPIPVLPRASEGAPSLEGVPKWFTHMDANGDGMIGRREFPGEPAQFAELDANQDGRIEWSEVGEWEKKKGATEVSAPAPDGRPQAESTPDSPRNP